MNWYTGTVAEAVAEAKRNNRLFLVYVEGSDDMSRGMTETYDDPLVVEKLASISVIAIKVTANSVPFMQFCAFYPVLVIPSSFFIGVDGSPIEIITGNLSASDFCCKMDKLFEDHKKIVEAKFSNMALHTTAVPLVSEASTSSASQVNKDSGPSTSQTLTSAETTLTMEDKVERAKALVEAQRLIKAKEETEAEQRQEIERRNMGKAIQQAEQTKQDNELKEWAKSRAKEKEEERLAREKVKAMIAQDRAERAAKYQRTKMAEEAEQQRINQNRVEAERAMRNAALASDDARIQFRLPNGSYTNHSFSADASLEEARRFVIDVMQPPFSNFTFCTTFPRRHFTTANYSETLRDLQLAPSAVLLILPSQVVSNTSPGMGYLTSLMWSLFSPIRIVWNFIVSLFPGKPQEPSQTQNPPVQQTPPPPPQANTESTRQTNSEKKSSFAKREGNVFRINNQSSDDDENNTWNGNSTQQM